MGFEYHIDIVGKVKHNKNVVWYFDKNGIRYTDTDIRRILGCLNEPMDVRLKALNNLVSTKLLQSGIDKISINMRVRGGKLVSSKGALESLELCKTVIYTICEDSSSGLALYKRMLEASYPNVMFKLITSFGNKALFSKFKEVVEGHSTFKSAFIVISDNKVEDAKYIENMALINEYVHHNKLANPVWVFNPICVEELILSNLNLKMFKESSINDMVKHYTVSGNPYFRYVVNMEGVGVYLLNDGSLIKNLEVALTSELTNKSCIRYSKKALNRCFVDSCCPVILMNESFSKRCRNYSPVSGWKSFCGDMSLYGGLQNVVDSILRGEQKNLSKWSLNNKRNLYRRL